MPIRRGGIVEAFDEQHYLVLQLDAVVLVEALDLYFRQARIVKLIAENARDLADHERMLLPSPDPERKSLAPLPRRGTFPPERREALREKRRARKR